MLHKKIITTLFFLIIFSNTSLADIKSAEAYTETVASNILKIASQKNKTTEQIRNDLIEYIKKNIDIEWISKFALGKHWKTANSKQKEQFTKLYEKYLINTYAPKFQGYHGETYKIISTKEVASGKYISKIILHLQSGADIGLEVFILEENNNYKIVDISGEGISFAATQRSEFNSMIKVSGLDKFLITLEKKVANIN